MERHRTVPGRSAVPRISTAAGVLLVLGLALTWWIAANLAGANARDLAANTFAFRLGQDQPWLASVASGISFLADGARNIVTVPIVAVVLVAARRWRWAVFLLVASQGGLLISNALKLTVARERPPLIEQVSGQVHLSFPSGHAFSGLTVWVSFALIAFYVLPRPWSTVLGWVVVAAGVLQGPARLVLAKHWVTDVLAAWCIGGAWLLLVWAGFCWWTGPRVPSPAPPSPAPPSPLR
jgi:undecaprenyl-diphosphatase